MLQRWATEQGNVPNDLNGSLMEFMPGDFNGDGRSDFVKIWAENGSMNADVHFSAANVNRLYGEEGADQLIGEYGDDVLDGGTGNDTLKGGAGADKFVFYKGSGSDWIIDFQDDIDSIAFSGFGDLTVSNYLALAWENSEKTVFDFGNGDILSVVGVSKSDLADDLLF